jgi:uncharacterized membrane protein YfhO
VHSISNEQLEFVVEAIRPSILLVTDSFDDGWRVRALEPGPQSEYQVLPADHALRAVPLAKGKHHFVMEFRPISVPIGFALSVFTLCAMAIALVLMTRYYSRRAERG